MSTPAGGEDADTLPTSPAQALHASVEKAARAEHKNAQSKLVLNTSIHTLPSVTSFTCVQALLRAAQSADATTVSRVGATSTGLVFSASLPTSSSTPAARGRDRADGNGNCNGNGNGNDGSTRSKRKRDSPELALVDRVQTAVDDLRRRGLFSNAELEQAEGVLTRAVYELRGTNGELAIESVGLFDRTLTTGSTEKRLVLAIRVHGGVAVAVRDLKSALRDCWSDGVLTVEECVMGIRSEDLPKTAEGRLSDQWGNRSMLVVTAVPRAAADAAATSTGVGSAAE